MNQDLWVALFIIAAGTYLLRVIPLIWMQRKLIQHEKKGSVKPPPDWLTVLGPTMISAMFGASLVPTHPTFAAWVATALGMLATLAVWIRTRSMGLPTLTGVFVFGVLTVLFG